MGMAVGYTIFKKIFYEISGETEFIVEIIDRIQIRGTQRTAKILLNDKNQLGTIITLGKVMEFLGRMGLSVV